MSKAVLLKPQSGITWGSMRTIDAWFRPQTFRFNCVCGGLGTRILSITVLMCCKESLGTPGVRCSYQNYLQKVGVLLVLVVVVVVTFFVDRSFQASSFLV